jgi:capsular exopolysaccharide synthesis family protein
MSSIRDALKRAERERLERMELGRDDAPRDEAARDGNAVRANASRPAPETDSSGLPPLRPTVPPSRTAPDSASAPSAPADLKVVGPPRVPMLEIPVNFTEELALFRHGVEAALPQPRRSLVMSAATSGEGVTTISWYLAASLAVRDAKKTCLIDANFKSPTATRLFDLLGHAGLSDYCTGRADLTDVLCKTDSPDLFVMGLGTDVYNPSLVLSHERARGLASELTQRFDYVLFDAGAVLGHAEASMLASTVDGVVLVVRANRTKREVLAKAEKLVRFSGGSVIGTVLNRRRYPIPESVYKRL